MDEEKKKAIFEQLKIELRSILLSSKDGVPEQLILSDYEMLSCQRLPYRELGYKSVAALLKAMPDVAKEIRLSSGDVVYKAVSDESTAHIQRLVGNQKSAKKRAVRGRGRGRGRGGTFRGGIFRGGRGGGGGSFRGSFTPQQPSADRGRGRGFGQRGVRARGGGFRGSSGFARDVRGPGRGGGDRPTSYRGAFTRSSNSGFAGDVRGNAGNTSDSRVTGDVRNHWKAAGADEEEEEDFDSGLILGLGDSPYGKENQRSTQQASPMVNLKIGVSSSGQRKIEAGSPLKAPGKPVSSSEIDAVTPGGQIDLRGWLSKQRHAGQDRPEDGLKGDQQKQTSSRPRVQPLSSNHAAPAPGKKKAGSPHLNTNQEYFKQDLPPRFIRQQQQQKQKQAESNNEEAFRSNESKFSKEESPQLQEQKALHTICTNNWVPPEDGPAYLEAYHKYFADRGQSAPQIEVVPGKAQRKRGFYGRLQHDGTSYFPLEILETEEQAKQNAARSFCITNKIPLPSSDYIKFASSASSDPPCPQPAWMASLTQQLRGSIQHTPAQPPHSSHPTASPSPPLSQGPALTREPAHQSTHPGVTRAAPDPKTPPGSPPSPQQSVPTPSVISEDPYLTRIIENIYKMLKPTGVWVKGLDQLFEQTYGHRLELDMLPHLRRRVDMFNLEEMTPGRFIVYPVALDAKRPIEANNNSTSPSSEGVQTRVNNPTPAATSATAPAAAPVSRASSIPDGSQSDLSDLSGDDRLQRLEQGSKLEVIFSFAYSTSEIYFQLAMAEDIVYEIEETLMQMCPPPPPPEWSVPDVGGLVAACYEDGWYRAQILASDVSQVLVYFIDYGNRESVGVSELRPLPQTEVTQGTPALALRFSLAPAQACHLQTDTHARMEQVTEVHPVMTAVVLDNSDEACIVELQTKNGAPLLPLSAPDLKQVQAQPSQTGQPLSNHSSTPDPGMLILPDTEVFAACICQIRTECIVLLRVVDGDYSDALDDLEQVIGDNFYMWSVPEEVKQRHVYAAMILATADEAQDEQLLDQNKYHRVRVQHQNEDGSFLCYLPDHSGEEIVQRSQLREIDPELNRTLPYQAVMATLHGLDHVEEALRSTAMEVLLKLINFSTPVYAIRRGSIDTLEVDIVDSDKDGQEVNINEAVQAALDEVRRGFAQGRQLQEIMHGLFGSSSAGSQADSGSVTSPSGTGEDDTEDLQVTLGRLSVTGDGDEAQARMTRVQDYVDDLPVTSAAAPGTGVKLYTWNNGGSNANGGNTAHPAESMQSVPDAVPSRRPLPPLPKFWPYALFKSVSLYIMSVESPSQFVAIPLEQQGALEKAESAMNQYFSTPTAAAENLSEQGLYAVKCKGCYWRALYLGHVGGMAKVFFPDHHLFDTVDSSEVLPLPEQFYSLPFLAYKMRLRAMKPSKWQDWPDETVAWFRESVCSKALYAVIFSQDGRPAGSKHTSGGGAGGKVIPGVLAVRLIDTSGEDDVIVDELMEGLGLAVSDAALEQA